MTSPDAVRSVLADYFRMIQAELHELVEPISTDQIWRKPYSYGNSMGNLILDRATNRCRLGETFTRPSANPSPKTGLPPSCAAPATPTTTSAKSYICKGNY